MPVVGEAIVIVRVRSNTLSRDIRGAVNDGFRGADRDVDQAGRRVADRFENSFRRERPRLSNLFGKVGKGLAGDIGNEFNLGIGAARMGHAVISALTLAGPSMLSGAAAMGTAIAGALTAGVASTLLTGGLLLAAFKSGADSIKPGLDTYKKLGASLGVAVADGMADGFNTSSHILTDQLLTPLYPMLNRAGELLGNMFTNLAKTITIPENLARIGQIMETNNHFIDRLDTGLQGLISSFLTLFAASKPMIDLVGNKFAEFGQWAASALSAAEANGTLASVMDKLTTLASAFFDWVGKLGPAIGAWLTNIDPAKVLAGFDQVGRFFGILFQAIGQIADGAGPHLVQIMTNINDVLQNMVNSGVIQIVADRIGSLLTTLTGFAAQLSNNPIVAGILALAAAWGLLGGVLQPLIGVISGIGSAFGAALAPIALIGGFLVAMWTQSENLRTAIGNLVTALGGEFSKIWDEISPKIQPLVDAFLKFAGALGDKLAPVIERLIPILVGFFDILGNVISFIFTQLTEFFGMVADLINGDWAGAWEHAKNLVMNFLQFFQDIFTQIGQWFFSIWWAIWDETLKGPIVAAYDWIVGILTAIHDFIAGVLNSIAEAVVAAGDWINNAWNTALTWVHDTAVNIWNNILNFVSNILSNIADSVSSAGDWINNAWNSALNWVHDTAVNIWNNVLDFISNILSNISDGVSNAGDWMNSAWNSALNWISDTAHSIWGGILGFLSGVWDSIAGVASSAFNAVKDAIVGPIEDAYNAVVGWVDNIRSAVQGAIDFISGKVTEANDKLGSIIATQAQAGTVTANMLLPDALPPPPGAALAALAKGGIITRPTIALVGEAGRERVEPLDSQGLSVRDRALIDQIVTTLTSRTVNGGTTVQVSIGDHAITDFITRQVDARNADLAQRVATRRRR